MRQGIAVFAVLLLAATTAPAQDTVYVKGKKAINGVIGGESPKGVTLKAGEFVAVDDIDDVQYDLNNKTVAGAGVATSIAYKAAVKAERESIEGAEAKRKASITAAYNGYAEVLPKISDKMVKRHLEYKLIALRARELTEDGKDASASAVKMVDYAKNHPTAWQSVQALKTAARIVTDANQYDQAEQIYKQLADLDISPDLKLDYELQAALVSVQAGKFDAAMKKLEAMAAKMPKGSRQEVRAKVAQAECLANAKKIDQAISMVKPILKDVTDKAGKAAAYNTLGYCYFQKEDFKQARWEFLWVDVVYNQDRNEHAKALYYLSQTFEKMNEPEKAQECREALLGDKAFASTEWVRKLQKSK